MPAIGARPIAWTRCRHWTDLPRATVPVAGMARSYTRRSGGRFIACRPGHGEGQKHIWQATHCR